jgi:hypothetical protein
VSEIRDRSVATHALWIAAVRLHHANQACNKVFREESVTLSIVADSISTLPQLTGFLGRGRRS